MLARFDRTIRVISQRISFEEQQLCSRIGVSIHDEDDFTSRLADRIESAIDGFVEGGYSWTVVTRKVPWRGKASEESRIGADLMIVLSVSSPDFAVSKGILVQSKLLVGVQEIRTNLMPIPFTLDTHLREQIDKMLRVTPESFVWIYGAPGVRAVRAGTMAACKTREAVLQLENRSLGHFMSEFLSCWHGDYRLNSIDKNFLADFEGYAARRTLLISAVSERDSGRE